MAKQRITVTVNEALSILRAAGMPATASTLADGIESGVYPFGRMVRKSETTGRRTFEIFRVDLMSWIDSKTPKEEPVQNLKRQRYELNLNAGSG